MRWLILSACFLVAAGVASTVLLSLAGISAFVGLTILFVDRRTRPPLPQAGGAVIQEPEASSKRQPS